MELLFNYVLPEIVDEPLLNDTKELPKSLQGVRIRASNSGIILTIIGVTVFIEASISFNTLMGDIC